MVCIAITTFDHQTRPMRWWSSLASCFPILNPNELRFAASEQHYWKFGKSESTGGDEINWKLDKQIVCLRFQRKKKIFFWVDFNDFPQSTLLLQQMPRNESMCFLQSNSCRKCRKLCKMDFLMDDDKNDAIFDKRTSVDKERGAQM